LPRAQGAGFLRLRLRLLLVLRPDFARNLPTRTPPLQGACFPRLLHGAAHLLPPANPSAATANAASVQYGSSGSSTTSAAAYLAVSGGLLLTPSLPGRCAGDAPVPRRRVRSCTRTRPCVACSQRRARQSALQRPGPLAFLAMRASFNALARRFPPRSDGSVLLSLVPTSGVCVYDTRGAYTGGGTWVQPPSYPAGLEPPPRYRWSCAAQFLTQPEPGRSQEYALLCYGGFTASASGARDGEVREGGSGTEKLGCRASPEGWLVGWLVGWMPGLYC
jgi:hypothetical protein